MGGRYQITQVYFNGQGTLGSSGPDELCSSVDDAAPCSRLLGAAFAADLSFLSPGVAGTAVTVLKSKAVPGVFGVFVADPKEAKAPEPRPKADDPAVGEAKLEPVKGEMALNGFLPPCEEVSPPRRFAAEKVRLGGSGLSLWDIDSESLLLERRVHKFSLLLSIGASWWELRAEAGKTGGRGGRVGRLVVQRSEQAAESQWAGGTGRARRRRFGAVNETCGV